MYATFYEKIHVRKAYNVISVKCFLCFQFGPTSGLLAQICHFLRFWGLDALEMISQKQISADIIKRKFNERLEFIEEIMVLWETGSKQLAN